jgi:hypothetical protein
VSETIPRPPKATAARVPLAWFDWLASAGPAQRADLEIVEGGHGIWWPGLDDGLSVARLMGGSEGA